MKWITSFCLLLGQSRGISGIYWSPCVRLNGSMVSVFALWQWKRGSPKPIMMAESASFCSAQLGHDLFGRNDFTEKHTNKSH